MRYLILITCTLAMSLVVKAQKVIPLPSNPVSGLSYPPEKTYFSDAWQTEVITNVSEPELLVFEPKGKKNGTAVIIAPGGGLYALSIKSEGTDAAKWLAERGVTAFVLKYHLVPTGEDGAGEFGAEFGSHQKETLDKVANVLPFSVQDGLNAIRYVREHAADYGVNPSRIGFMGFSAGGAVTMGVAYNYSSENRPDFLVPVYAWTTAQPVQKAPADAPPMCLVCASDDGLGLASGSVELYNSWYTAGFPVALHMYSKGNHGFGMKKQGLPADSWIERVYEWAVSEKLVQE